MVLWELTLATAYFLGLKRAYRLAIKLERKLFRRYPRVLDFTQRRTRNVFDIALKVHREIQMRDLSAGRSLGNWILRMLHRIRPSADIRGSVTDKKNSGSGCSAKHIHYSEKAEKSKEPTKDTNLSNGRLECVHTFLNSSQSSLMTWENQGDFQSRTGSSGKPKLLSESTSSLPVMALQIYTTSIEKNRKFLFLSNSSTPAIVCRLPSIEPADAKILWLKDVIRKDMVKRILASYRR
ncbi:hypothetical protein O6H91_09G036500 [Diphasiastrum complanatum]|uniref:Uncharacterized protein n=1 Tax=Diphasiastrum complanatum TaxID=34168 RepID=A0ACC2CN18_DIPCM|nr:hypothetical protein O6H91_09G036500 [Diphasiastrum complanatum]